MGRIVTVLIAWVACIAPAGLAAAKPSVSGRKLPLASSLPELRAGWTASKIDEIGPLPRDGQQLSALLAHPVGRDALIGLDPASGAASWSAGRQLDDTDRSHSSEAIIGSDVLFFKRDGGIGIARISDGTERFSVPGTRCELGHIAGNGQMALVFCRRFSIRFLTPQPGGRGTREEADWIGVDLATGKVQYTMPAERSVAALYCSGATCVAQTFNFSGRPPLPDGRTGGTIAIDIASGKTVWRSAQSATLVGVRGNTVALVSRELVVLDLATGRVRWRAPLRPTKIYYGMIYGNVAVGDGVVVAVKPDAVETLDAATGRTRDRHPLPALPAEADVEVAVSGRRILVFIEGGGLGDGYLIIEDGSRETVLRSPASAMSARVFEDQLVVGTAGDTWTSYPLSSIQVEAPVATRRPANDRIREIIRNRRLDENLAELRAIPDHDKMLADFVRTEPHPSNIAALEALQQLGSPNLRSVSEEVLQGPDTAERGHLIDFALFMLEALDGPVRLALLSPYLQPAPKENSQRMALIATLLARGGADELRALDAMYGKLPGRMGWQNLCDGVDTGAASGDGRQPQPCHDSASQGRVAVAIADDAVWLRGVAIRGPAWLGTLGLPPRWPPRHPPAYFDVKSLSVDAQTVQLSGEVHLPNWPTSPLQFTGALDQKLHDSDRDGIPDDTERCLGTSPDAADTDGDGLPDAADPAPTTKAAQADVRAAQVRAALTYVARFIEPSLWSVAIVDAPAGFQSVTEGVAAVTLTTAPATDCHLEAVRLKVQPDVPSGEARRRGRQRVGATITVDAVSVDGNHGAVRAVFDYGFHGRTFRFDLASSGGVWRVVRFRVEDDWIE